MIPGKSSLAWERKIYLKALIFTNHMNVHFISETKQPTSHHDHYQFIFSTELS